MFSKNGGLHSFTSTSKVALRPLSSIAARTSWIRNVLAFEGYEGVSTRSIIRTRED